MVLTKLQHLFSVHWIEHCRNEFMDLEAFEKFENMDFEISKNSKRWAFEKMGFRKGGLRGFREILYGLNSLVTYLTMVSVEVKTNLDEDV